MEILLEQLVEKGYIDSYHNSEVGLIFTESMELIEKGGMAEYHDPLSGQGCGGAHFTWTAAMVLEFLEAYDIEQ